MPNNMVPVDENTQQMLLDVGLRDVRFVASGMEHAVWRAEHADFGGVAVKVPLHSVHSNANDEAVDGTELLEQEQRVTKHLYEHGLPVAQPYQLLRQPCVALISRWIESSPTARLNSQDLGSVVARLHALEPPSWMTMAHEGAEFATAVQRRTQRRWSALSGELSDAPLPPLFFPPYRQESLLHLDLRRDNCLLDEGGRLLAILDWSNCMIGPSEFELARIFEYSRYASNQLAWDLLAQRADCGKRWEGLGPSERLTLQLDTAIMLAVPFNREMPGASEGPIALERVRQIADELRAL